jgi:HSP20 family protein
MAKAQEEIASDKAKNGPKGEPGQTLTRSQNALAAQVLPLLSPFGLLGRFMEDFVRLMDGMASVQSGARDVGAGLTGFVPTLEMFERDGEVVVRVDVPGMSKDQIKIEVDGRQLIISGERTEQREEQQAGLYGSERSYGRFSRVVVLPQGVRPDEASATFSDGVLEIAIKAPERPKPKPIEIQERVTARPPQQAGATASSAS